VAILIQPYNSSTVLVDENGVPSAPFQKLLQALVNVAMQPGFCVLLLASAPVPNNWVQVDTITSVGGKTYNIIQPK
jgi:hypothetical protein